MKKVTIRIEKTFLVDVESEDEAFDIATEICDKMDLGEGCVDSEIECCGDADETDRNTYPVCKLKPFDVTFARTGCAVVYAEDEADAISKANELTEDEISWTDNFDATDAQEC